MNLRKTIFHRHGPALLILTSGLLAAIPVGLYLFGRSSSPLAAFAGLLAVVLVATGCAWLASRGTRHADRMRTEQLRQTRMLLAAARASKGAAEPSSTEEGVSGNHPESKAVARPKPLGHAHVSPAPATHQSPPKRNREVSLRLPKKESEVPSAEQKSKWLLEHELILPYQAKLSNRRYYNGPHLPELSSFRVGIISDEFTHNSFVPEFNAVVLTPANWRAELEQKLDLIFVESAWRGMPTSQQPWRGRVYASIRFKTENRTDLLALLAEARKRGIPSVFWNKEDPTHFTDRVNDFVSTAAACDFVMTTAQECVAEYEKFMAPGAVGVMPMAVQPRLFNPLGGPQMREHAVVFAGSWYRVHPEREIVMRSILDEIIASDADLVIYDRYYNSESSAFAFPERYRQFTRPPVAHNQTAEVYRSWQYGLNINTVVNSRTMFARRAFEMAACGIQMISNHSVGMREIFGDSVIWLGPNEKSLASQIDAAEAGQREISALNIVLREHTYERRVESMLELVGIKYSEIHRKTTLVATVETESDVRAALAALCEAGNVAQSLVLVASRSIPTHEVQSYYTRFISSRVKVVSQQYWIERGVPTETILDTPTAFLLNLREPITRERIARSLHHHSYSDHPVLPAPTPGLPVLRLQSKPNGCLISASELTAAVTGRFPSDIVMVV